MFFLDIAEKRPNPERFSSQWLHRLRPCYLLMGAAFIAAVSIYDTLLVFEFREGIMEENPFCRYLIQLDPDTLVFFLTGKLLGTSSVLICLVWISLFRPIWSVVVTTALVIFQSSLLYYLQVVDTYYSVS